jgi:hypothetical protein
MRLNEFADPKPYTLSADDATDFLKQLERIWPHKDVAFVLGIKRQPPNKRTKLSDALSIGSHVGGVHHRDRRGASQWPTA